MGRRDPAAIAASEAGIALSPETVAKIDGAEANKPVIIMPRRQPELTPLEPDSAPKPEPAPVVEDEEFLENLNLRDTVDRELANLKPIAEMDVGTNVVPDVGVYIIRDVLGFMVRSSTKK